MPLCRPFLRSLLHSRTLHQYSKVDQRRSSNVVQGQRRDNNSSADEASSPRVPANSAYLDFILGSHSDPPPAISQDGPVQLVTSERNQSEGFKRDPALIGKRRVESFVEVETRRSEGKERPKRFKSRKTVVRRSAISNQYSKAAWLANQEFHQLRSQGIRLRSKFVGVKFGSSKGFFSRYWNSNFALLDATVNTTSSSSSKTERKPLNLNRLTSDWVQQVSAYLEHDPEPSQVCKVLHKDPRRAVSRWQSVALWFLDNDPKRTIEFLRASNTIPYPPLSCVEDSLQYLAKRFTNSFPREPLIVWQKLYDLFVEIAEQRSDQRLWMQSSFFRLLMQHCGNEQVHKLYQIIKRRDVKISWHTYLHFATYFARNDHFDLALDAVLEAHGAGAALDSYAFRSNCATLLRTAIRRPGGLRATMRILHNLVDIGLPLNTQLCNIVMLNAVEAGDLKTAFSVYHSLVKHGLEADVYTYCILLKGCRANIDDAEALTATIHDAIGGTNLLQHVVLATEILHCLALHHTRRNPTNAYETVVDAYSQMFDVVSLQELGLPLPQSLPSGAEKKKLLPNQYTVNIMLATYLDQYFLQARSTAPIHGLYQRFRSLAEAGREPFNLLAETDHTANIFLKSFTRTKKGLLYAAEVIKHMQRPLPLDAKVQQCPPSVQSWSIFLHGFTRHKQLQLAEQVLNFMRAQQLQPNHVTWTSLIAGYAGAQDVDRVLDTIRRGEADGAVWDDWTMSGLRRLVDQKQLQLEFRKKRLESSLDFTQELREGLETRLSLTSSGKDVESDSI